MFLMVNINIYKHYDIFYVMKVNKGYNRMAQ